MRKVLAHVLPLLLAGVTALSAQGNDAGQTVLNGVVIDAADKVAVRNAIVSVDGVDGVAVTDSAGRFRIASVPSGQQLVRVRRLGYVSEARTIDLAAAGALTVQLVPHAGVPARIDEVLKKLEKRRSNVQMRAQAFDVTRLANDTTTLAAFATRIDDRLWPCPADVAGPDDRCFRARGRYHRLRVYIDERHVPTAPLAQYMTQDFELVEYYGNGFMLRLYTADFLVRAATGDVFLSPTL